MAFAVPDGMTRKRSSRDKRQRPDRSDTLEAGQDAADYTATDQDRVDDIGDALGVPRAPDDEFKTSGEILEERDRYRWEEEE